MNPSPSFSQGIFRCPITKSPLRPATGAELASVNEWLASQATHITLGDGTSLAPPWTTAWTSESTPSIYYPVINNIPVLVPDAGVTINGK